jgi:hypothetical protein
MLSLFNERVENTNKLVCLRLSYRVRVRRANCDSLDLDGNGEHNTKAA